MFCSCPARGVQNGIEAITAAGAVRRGLFMKIELTERQYRYLLDLVYIGNWVLNSTREDDRIKEYD